MRLNLAGDPFLVEGRKGEGVLLYWHWGRYLYSAATGPATAVSAATGPLLAVVEG